MQIKEKRRQTLKRRFEPPALACPSDITHEIVPLLRARSQELAEVEVAAAAENRVTAPNPEEEKSTENAVDHRAGQEGPIDHLF